jgi:hypothetical protein
MDELVTAAERIVDHYKQQSLDKDAKLPIGKSIKEGLEFLNLEEI